MNRRRLQSVVIRVRPRVFLFCNQTMGKIKSKKGRRSVHVPLGQQIEEDSVARPSLRQKIKRKIQDELEEAGIEFLDAKTSQRIMGAARKQQEELTEEFGDIFEPGAVDEDDVNDVGARGNDDLADQFLRELQIDEADERILASFIREDRIATKTLADFVAEKIQEKETQGSAMSQVGSIKLQKLDPRVVELYRGVKAVLSRYRSGKIPKAFKIIPNIANWEQVLELTGPETWTASAMYAATRLFTSNLKERMAQRFFNLILLPRVRDDIYEYKRLNYHLYQALRKALFKPGAFIKGIILPLCEAGDCSLRESVIISSIMAKHSMPNMHVAAAILKICEYDYSGASSIFLHVLLRKKCQLPYRVVDGVVEHYMKFKTEGRLLPVIWHQTLLIFVQNYKSDMTRASRDSLYELLRIQMHHQITPIVRQELANNKFRDDMDDGNNNQFIDEKS